MTVTQEAIEIVTEALRHHKRHDREMAIRHLFHEGMPALEIVEAAMEIARNE
jgi:hypothetical protein